MQRIRQRRIVRRDEARIAAPPLCVDDGAWNLQRGLLITAERAEFNDRVFTGVDSALFVGEELFAQYWSRDSADRSGANLTNAVAFYVNS